MKQLVLTKDGSLKVKRLETALYERDVEELPKSCLCGEWVLFRNEKTHENYIGFVNTFVSKGHPSIRILDSVDKNFSKEKFEPYAFLEKKILKAIHYRTKFFSLDLGARLIFGEEDGLPGLIVDEFVEAIFVQINTAGLDLYRTQIKKIISEARPLKKIFLFDQEKYRALENLPHFEEESFNQNLKVVENGLNFEIPFKGIQKIGYYYDHRFNRLRAQNILRDLKIKKEKGLDLFCYVGSWGIHLLMAGLEFIDFVDQGDFLETINENLKLNNLSDKGLFFRNDVFKFLDTAVERKQKYDVICSDPPAFAKNLQNKNNALEGYQKLHLKILKLINPGGLLFVGSCTHYVSLDELDITISEAAKKLHKTIRLVDLGLQSPDHPIRGISDRGNYIKYLAYIVDEE